MIALEVDTKGLIRMEKSLALLADKQLRYAMARALNDCTRAASVGIDKAMPEIFDRPTPFTDRAAVAPRALAATSNNLVSTVTLRDIQAQYLTNEEEGGTRTPGMNTRRPDAKALVLPGPSLKLNVYGNIPNGTLQRFREAAAADLHVRRERAAKVKASKLSARAYKKVNGAAPTRSGTVFYLPASSPANKSHNAGYFRRLNKMQIARLTAFEPEAHYRARMGYHARVEAMFKDTWEPAMAKRFGEAIASMR